MNSPFVIYSKRQLYLSILFIVLLLEVFTILPTSSTFVNNGNSLKHKIVQYLNHEKNTAQSSRFEDEEENKCPCECCNTKCPCCVKLTFCCLAALAG